MSVNSKSIICNFALTYLKQDASVKNIDTPNNPIERVFALHYDFQRELMLRKLVPSFAVKYVKAVKLDEPMTGFASSFQYPKDAVKVLGIGNVEDSRNNYSVLGGAIHCDDDYPDGIPLRIIYNEEDTSRFSQEFIELFSLKLAIATCLKITGDEKLLKYLLGLYPTLQRSLMSLDATENKPIKIRRSKSKLSRYSTNTRLGIKKWRKLLITIFHMDKEIVI